MRRLRDALLAVGLGLALILRYLAILVAMPAAVALVAWTSGPGSVRVGLGLVLIVVLAWLLIPERQSERHPGERLRR